MAKESGLAAVSKDGQYIVTCAGGDSPSGFVRSYKVSDGTKVAEQNYTMDTNCKPYEIFSNWSFCLCRFGNG